ncbi:1-acyl-sn-glycerol-3-phosphate acyltransferase [Bacteroidota bacterium]
MKGISLKILIHLLLIRPFVQLLFGVNLFGKENISNHDSYILVSNHNSHFDILLLFYLLPVKHISKTHPVAAKEYFSKSKIVFQTVNYLFSPIWVSRGEIKANIGFLDELRDNLKNGHNLIIFPEGTRGLPGEVQAFQSCIGKISQEHPEIPIIPVFLSGPERLLPRKSSIPIPLWNHVTISPPQVFEEAAKVITHSLEESIRDLARKENAIRHKRKPKKSRCIKSIAVLGIDGSGKSTLSEKISIALSATEKVVLVTDKLKFYNNGKPQKMPPFLAEHIRRAIGSYAKNAKSLKLYKAPKLAELLLRNSLIPKIKRWHNPDCLVMDGSPILNLTAWSILYKEKLFSEVVCAKAIKILCSKGDDIPPDDPVYSDFPELKKLKRIGLAKFDLPEIVLFLDADPKIAISRINKRGEKRQVHEKEEKLAKLRDAYLCICNILPDNFDVPTLIISGNNSIEETTNRAIDFINKHLKGGIGHEK